MDKPEDDAGLRPLLADAVEVAETMIAGLRCAAPPAGDDGYLWRWSFFFLVLAYDLADSALVLSDGRHNRALLILRRVMFEHMTRLKFYRKRPEIARAHLDDFTPRARLFQRRLGDDGYQIIPDPAFDEALHDPQKKFRNFEIVLNKVFPEKADELYAQFYQYPSALIHGDAFASSDIIEMQADGKWKVHGSSRRTKTNETLYNYVAFFISLLEDAFAQLNVGSEAVAKLRERQDAVRRGLGMDTLVEQPDALRGLAQAFYKKGARTFIVRAPSASVQFHIDYVYEDRVEYRVRERLEFGFEASRQPVDHTVLLLWSAGAADGRIS